MTVSDKADSLEFPVMVHCEGKPAVMGIIERLSLGECRLRSLVAFEVGARVDFELVVHGGAHAKIVANVTSFTEARPRRYYDLRIDTLGVGEREALSRVVAELHARHSSSRVVNEGGALARASVRAPVDFPVAYSVAGASIGTGSAANISVGGMLMMSSSALVVGSTLELTFALDLGGGRRKELVVNARIVAHQERSAGRWANHIAFFGLDPSARAIIAEYVDAGTARS